MNKGSLIGLILGAIVVAILCFVFYRKYLKPVNFYNDSTICFTGGLGSAKTLSSTKIGVKAFKRVHRRWKIDCFLSEHFGKIHKSKFNEEPQFISNIPVRWIDWKNFKAQWRYSVVLEREHLLGRKRIPENSVVLIDETPQFINQFEFGKSVVQNDFNDMITFFRHYTDGLLICNAQSLDEIESHLRRKLNSYYYCFDFQKLLCFYRVRVLRCRVGDVSVSMTNDFIEDNAKWHYGFLPFIKRYDSRCYSVRYDKVQDVSEKEFERLKTARVLKLDSSKVCYLDFDENGELYR